MKALLILLLGVASANSATNTNVATLKAITKTNAVALSAPPMPIVANAAVTRPPNLPNRRQLTNTVITVTPVSALTHNTRLALLTSSSLDFWDPWLTMLTQKTNIAFTVQTIGPPQQFFRAVAYKTNVAHLIWNASVDSDRVAGYLIHHGRRSGIYTNAINAGKRVEYFLWLPPGTNYVALTAYDSSPGNESPYSNEAVVVMDMTTPARPILKITRQ